MCHVRASYGIDTPRRCAMHKTDDMRDLRSKRCSECDVRASYGFAAPTHCAAHRTPSMRDLRSRVCDADGCTNRARLCAPGTTTATVCWDHARAGWRYAYVEYCTCGRMHRGGGRCAHCTSRGVEARILTALRHRVGESVTWIGANATITDRACHITSRPDAACTLEDGSVVCIEIDEDEHAQYPVECEVMRMLQIFHALGGPAVLFVRIATPRRGVREIDIQRRVDEAYVTIQEFRASGPHVTPVFRVRCICYSETRVHALQSRIDQLYNAS